MRNIVAGLIGIVAGAGITLTMLIAGEDLGGRLGQEPNWRYGLAGVGGLLVIIGVAYVVRGLGDAKASGEPD